MSRIKTYKTQAVVLKQVPIGESDCIIILHTPDRGKLRLVAKGVRLVKSKMGGYLEPLSHVWVSVAEGRSLDRISGVETICTFRGLKENLQGLSKGIYVAELVEGFSEEELPSRQIFELLVDVLSQLESDPTSSWLPRYFEVSLLRHSGFGPELYQCVDCYSTLNPGNHFYSCASGGLLCPECLTKSGDMVFQLSLNSIKILRYLQVNTWSQTSKLTFPSTLLAEIEKVLVAYVTYVLGRNIKSLDFMNSMSSVVPR